MSVPNPTQPPNRPQELRATDVPWNETRGQPRAEGQASPTRGDQPRPHRGEVAPSNDPVAGRVPEVVRIRSAETRHAGTDLPAAGSEEVIAWARLNPGRDHANLWKVGGRRMQRVRETVTECSVRLLSSPQFMLGCLPRTSEAWWVVRGLLDRPDAPDPSLRPRSTKP